MMTLACFEARVCVFSSVQRIVEIIVDTDVIFHCSVYTSDEKTNQSSYNDTAFIYSTRNL